MRFDRSGIAVDLPPGWEASLHRRDATPAGQPRALSAAEHAPGATTHPVLHAASVPLPPDRGDYGSGAVDLLGTGDVFVSLVEFHPDAARTPLFAVDGPPRRLSSDDFRADSLQRTVPGQSGCQRFFRSRGRAFCLYVVLGSHARRHLLVPVVNALLETLDIAASDVTVPDPTAASDPIPTSDTS
jgi:hypothetical protein